MLPPNITISCSALRGVVHLTQGESMASIKKALMGLALLASIALGSSSLVSCGNSATSSSTITVQGAGQ